MLKSVFLKHENGNAKFVVGNAFTQQLYGWRMTNDDKKDRKMNGWHQLVLFFDASQLDQVMDQLNYLVLKLVVVFG